MIDTNGGAQIVDQLRALLDRLGAPDLNLSEAKTLRKQVQSLVAERAPASTIVGGVGSPVAAGRKLPASAAVLLRSR